jgi:tryptophan-rich sensory protein
MLGNGEVIHRFIVWALLSLSIVLGLCLYFGVSLTNDWLLFLGLAALTALNIIYLTVKLKKVSPQAARCVGGFFPIAAAIYLTQFHFSMNPDLQMFQIFITSLALNAIVHLFLIKRLTAH